MLPRPFVKWSYEPPRPQDVPAALGPRIPPRAAPAARAGVRLGPDGRLVGRGRRGVGARRSPDGRPRAAPRRTRRRSQDLARRLAGASNPVLVAGPGRRRRAGAWDAAVALAERCRLPVWAPPASGSGRVGFPEDHPNFQGLLPPAIAAAGADPRSRTTSCSSSVRRCSPTTRTSRGRCCRRGRRSCWSRTIRDEAARAPLGDAIVADVALTLEALLAQCRDSGPARLPRRGRRPSPRPSRSPIARCGRDGGARRGAPRRRASS